MHDLSEHSLVLDDDEGHAHASAESGQPHDQLDGVHVVGDDNQLGLLLLDQGGDLVEPEDQRGGVLLGEVLLDVLAFLLALNELLVLLAAVLLGLGAVLLEEPEEGLGVGLVKSVVEDVERGGHLEALLQDGPLALQLDLAGHADPSAQVEGLALGVHGARGLLVLSFFESEVNVFHSACSLGVFLGVSLSLLSW